VWISKVKRDNGFPKSDENDTSSTIVWQIFLFSKITCIWKANWWGSLGIWSSKSNIIKFISVGSIPPISFNDALCWVGQLWRTLRAEIAEGVCARSSTILYFWATRVCGLNDNLQKMTISGLGHSILIRALGDGAKGGGWSNEGGGSSNFSLEGE